jgi:hypothetical protein
MTDLACCFGLVAIQYIMTGACGQGDPLNSRPEVKEERAEEKVSVPQLP